MAPSSRTLGWVQDAQRLDKCRMVVAIVGERRPIAFVDLLPLVRARLGVGRWADDNYVRFAHALGFLAYERDTDEFSLTPLGDELLLTPIGRQSLTPSLFGDEAAELETIESPRSKARLIRDSSPEEIDVFSRGLLSYPPVSRVLDLLEKVEHRTKFDLGQQLGFVGEEGFTSIPEARYVVAVARDGKAKHDFEGTADKYARCIGRWCEQMGWVENTPKIVTVAAGETRAGAEPRQYTVTIRHAYKLTDAGRQAWRRGRGVGVNAREPKRTPIEMLASRALPGADYVRQRRMAVLETLQRAKSQGASIDELLKALRIRELVATPETVADDLRGLTNTGLQLREVGPTWILRDTVELDRPAGAGANRGADAVDQQIVELQPLLRYVPTRFIELIRQAFDSDREREFESGVEEVLRHLLDFATERLGGGLEPDVLAWHHAEFPRFSYGIIVDAKAARAGYAITIESADQMTRYVRDWERRLLREREIPRAYFLFVSSMFRGPLNGLNTVKARTQVDGAAITARNLLYLAERLSADRARANHRTIQTLLACQTEITQAMIDAAT